MLVHVDPQQIDAYWDGELREAQSSSLLAHCKECEACRISLENRRLFIEAIRSARPSVRASAALYEKVNGVLTSESDAVRKPVLLKKLDFIGMPLAGPHFF